MIEAQSLSMAVPSSVPLGDATDTLTLPPVTTPRGRAALLITILLVSAAVGTWIFFEATHILQMTESGTGAGLLPKLNPWQVVATGSILAGVLISLLLMMVAFHVVNKSWSKQLQAVQSEATSASDRLRIQSDHFRVLIAEKSTAEEHLLSIRRGLEGRISTLTSSNDDMKAELDRLKRTERTMAMQSQTLVASKDVLQIHVQVRQQELQKLQRQCELILNAAGEGICGIDSAGKITFVNPTAARLMGLEVGKMVGCKETDVFGALADIDATTVKKDSVITPSEVILKRAGGSPFTAEFVRSQILENDRVVGRVVLFKDITERKQAAEALVLKADELARSNAELEQFAFVASHDLQEPLRKIRAFGDRLKTKCESVLPEEGADYLGRMQNAAARMQTLIADLLTFSRVISRTDPFVEVDLGQITREVLGDLEVRIEKTGATVTVGDLPKIEADPVHMQQLLQNLIGNALKFQCPDTKPQVRVSGRITRVGDDASCSVEPVCELTVQDNGIGFDEKYLDKIFAVFQRLHNRQEYEGTGIGLAVCRRIVDRHKGSITARSKPGEGATFIVHLPLRAHAKDKTNL